MNENCMEKLKYYDDSLKRDLELKNLTNKNKNTSNLNIINTRNKLYKNNEKLINHEKNRYNPPNKSAGNGNSYIINGFKDLRFGNNSRNEKNLSTEIDLIKKDYKFNTGYTYNDEVIINRMGVSTRDCDKYRRKS